MIIFVSMVFPAHFEEKVGMDRVRQSVAARCQHSAAKTLLAEQGFLSDPEAIRTRLEPIRECTILLEETSFSAEPYEDLGSALEKLGTTGAYLVAEEVAALRKNIHAVRHLLQFFRKKEMQEQYPALAGLCGLVKLYPIILERIDKVLSRHGTIRDHASRELSGIRTDLAGLQKQVSRRLRSILKSVQQEGLAEEDVNVSMRNGRPVIPVPSARKRQLTGIIHDESSSGKTVFIEPAEIVGINNQIRELEYAENREIIRILVKLSQDLGPYAEDLREMDNFLVHMDMIQAKAGYALEVGAVMPELRGEPCLEWARARHPILLKTLEKENRQVVPLDIQLSSRGRMLLISGPNAGGKSVCLKTVGLLQYMMQCGFLVPMDQDSSMGVFRQIFIDIGDEQSIDNDLSTYSSHLLNMKHFLRNADHETLLLIDELGTGTEPMLGGAIAETILEQLNAHHAWGVITTHYSNLKHFAAEAEGIENGAMLFDTGQMRPLYRLEIGQPGSSFAIEIARNIGLPEEVIRGASDRVGEDQISFDRHLREIIRDKRYWEGKRDKIRISEKKLQEILGRYAAELETAEQTRKEILKKARAEAEELLRQANRRIENTIREIKEAQAEKEKTRQARERLARFREESGAAGKGKDPVDQKIERVREEEQKVRKRRQRFGQAEPVRKPVQQDLDPTIREGDHVMMKGQEVAGEVLERKGNKVYVRFGHLKTRVSVDQLQKVERQEATPPADRGRGDLGDWDVARRKMHFRPEIDVRGKRAEEALQSVAALVDEAIMVQQHELRILHGKGDGILRQLIRQYLSTIDLVASYGDEHVDLGGAGVTIVNLDL